MAKRILSISNNPRLLAARNDVLAVAGYSVASPRNPGDAALLFRQNPCDVVIIGHSVGADQRSQIIQAIRALEPEIPVIFAAPAGHPPESLANAAVDIANPEMLMETLARLLP